jgi:hypothetical protein
MNAMPDRWRRIANKIARHASWVLPGSRSPWAEAMRRELEYIEDDRAALRWAIGCVMASYAARLAALPRLRWRALSRPVLAGSMLLFIALAMGHAGDRTAPSPAVFEDTTCDLPDMSPDNSAEAAMRRGPCAARSCSPRQQRISSTIRRNCRIFRVPIAVHRSDLSRERR